MAETSVLDPGQQRDRTSLSDETVSTGPPPGSDQASRWSGRLAQRDRVSPYGVFAGLWAAFLPVAFLSNVAYPTFVPKYVIMLVAAGVGIVPLARLTKEPHARWAAWGAIGFLAVALLSAALSSAPGIGFAGLYLWGTGWLFWLSCAGAFAIGATLRGRDLKWAFYGLLTGAGLNAVMAVYQIVFQPASAALKAYANGTQADGFLGNPVHLEALLLGAIALCAARFCDAPRRWWWFLLLLGVGLEFTSERVFIPILVVIFAVVIYQRRLRGVLFSAVVALGCGIGYVGGGSDLGQRVSSGTSQTTFGLRFELWRDAARGLVHHPVLGTGPGQTLGATAPYVHAGFGHNLNGRLFTDAHNFLVEVTITTGILGLAFFVAWLFGVARIARGPFVAFVISVLAVELVEPMNIGVTPLAFLALGAAVGALLYSFERSVREGEVPATGRTAAAPASAVPASAVQADEAAPLDLSGDDAVRSAKMVSAGLLTTVIAVAASLFVGVTMYVGVTAFSKTTTQNLATATAADTLVPYWPESAANVGFYWRYRYAVDHSPALERSDLLNARSWYLKAAGRDPADPVLWWEVAQIDHLLGNNSDEATMLAKSLQADPWLPASLSSAAFLAASEGHMSSALGYLQDLQLVRPLSSSEQQLLRSVRAHLNSH